MSKRNKDIQVQVTEEQRKNVTVTKLTIGKKVIGEVVPANKGFQAFKDGDLLGNYKTLDEGIEGVISNWNLHD